MLLLNDYGQVVVAREGVRAIVGCGDVCGNGAAYASVRVDADDS